MVIRNTFHFYPNKQLQDGMQQAWIIMLQFPASPDSHLFIFRHGFLKLCCLRFNYFLSAVNVAGENIL
jgi:hypothetical protein